MSGIRTMNVNGLDLNLVKILDALLGERGVGGVWPSRRPQPARGEPRAAPAAPATCGPAKA